MHLTCARSAGPFPTRALPTPSSSRGFPSFVSDPSVIPCASGILLPCSLPWFPSFLWPPSPPALEQPPVCLQLSRVLVRCPGLLFYRFPVFCLDRGMSILPVLLWGGETFSAGESHSTVSWRRKARGFVAFRTFTNQMDLSVGSKCSPALSLPPFCVQRKFPSCINSSMLEQRLTE